MVPACRDHGRISPVATANGVGELRGGSHACHRVRGRDRPRGDHAPSPDTDEEADRFNGPPASLTDRFKYDVAYPAYGTPPSEKTELDHLVSLELGGSNDATNLWPESPPTPNPKDKVENALHDAVCGGRITLAAAQHAIASDWLTAEKKLGLSAAGE